MPVLPCVSWLVFLWLAGWLFFPFSRRLWGELLPDSGLALGRILFLTCWSVWAFWGGTLGLSTQTTAWAYALGFAVGVAAFWRQKTELHTLIARQKRAIVAGEALFLTVF